MARKFPIPNPGGSPPDNRRKGERAMAKIKILEEGSPTHARSYFELPYEADEILA